MRQLATLPSEHDAQRLGDYLLTLKIGTHIDRGSAGWEVWVRDEDHVERARQELQGFLANPEGEAYETAHKAAEEIRKEKRLADEEFKRNYREVAKEWSRPLLSRCPVTFTLLAGALVVGIMTEMGESNEALQNKLRITEILELPKGQGWDTRLPEIRNGQVWRLFTPVFLHYGILHIVFNTYSLYVLGLVLESRRDWWRIGLLALVAGVLGNLGQCYVTGPRFGGLSGIIYALFGYAWMKSRFEPQLGILVPPQAVVMMVGFYLLCFTGLFPIGNTAHTIGFGIGLVAGVGRTVTTRLFRRAPL